MLLLLGGTLYLLYRPQAYLVPGRTAWMLAGIALVVRLLPSAVLAYDTDFDIQSFQLTGEVLAKGQDVYTDELTQNRHPYLPLQMYAMYGAYRIADATNLPFPFVVRLLPVFVDASIALLLFYRLLNVVSASEAFRWGLIYALNPVTVLVSAAHGQFDALPALLTLLALLSVPYSLWKTGLFLGLGILDKSWPILAWPQIMARLRTWRERFFVTLLMGIVPLMAVAVYSWVFDANPVDSVRKAVSYNWGTGIWGYTYFLRMGLMHFPKWPLTWTWFLRFARWLTLGFLGWLWFVRARHQSPVAGFLTILLGFLAWGHAFSIQYLLWIVPFAVYQRERIWLARYVLAACAYMFLAYYTLIFQNSITNLLPWPQADWFIIMPAGIPAWLVVVFWLRSKLRDTARRDENHSSIGSPIDVV